MMMNAMMVAKGNKSDADAPYHPFRTQQDKFWGIGFRGRIIIPCTMTLPEAEELAAILNEGAAEGNGRIA
jgi:hypothetical protein